MTPFPLRRLAPLAALVTLAVAAACSERLDTGANCPTLCPATNTAVRDTVLDAVALDTTLAGFPGPGEGTYLLVATRPADSLDVRAVLRFDSLPSRYFPITGGDSVAITAVDSAVLRLRIDTTSTRYTQPLTVEAYDVDTTFAVDTVAGALARLFRADRLLGSTTLQPGAAKVDSLRIPIRNTALAGKITTTKRLRVGLRVTSTAAAQLRVLSARGGNSDFGATLSLAPKTDTGYVPLVAGTRSGTPVGAAPALIAGLRDFTFVVRNAAGALPNDLVVGGLPARRVFLRFNVPARLADSTTIVRALLEFTQRPARGQSPTDTVVIRPEAVIATEAITDLRRAADFTASPSVLRLDSLALVPTDSGARTLSLVSAVRAWRAFPAGTQRAITLRSLYEGSQAGEIRLFSVEAPAALRPRLRISYIPRTDTGLP